MENIKILVPDVSLGYAIRADRRSRGTRMAGEMDGPAFAERRETLGMTQSELANRFGVNRVTVAKWETNDLPIRKVTVLALERLEETEKRPRKKDKKK